MPHDMSMTNRELVLSLIPNNTEGISVDELAAKTGFDRWQVIACIWLSSAKLSAVHTQDPLEIRWRKVEEK